MRFNGSGIPRGRPPLRSPAERLFVAEACTSSSGTNSVTGIEGSESENAVEGNSSVTSDEDRKKRPRTAFTASQIKSLEAEFERNKYLSVAKRLQLSKCLKLTETQVIFSQVGSRGAVMKSGGKPLAITPNIDLKKKRKNRWNAFPYVFHIKIEPRTFKALKPSLFFINTTLSDWGGKLFDSSGRFLWVVLA